MPLSPRQCMCSISACLPHASIFCCCSNVKTWFNLMVYQSCPAAPAPPTRAMTILCLRTRCARSRRTTPCRRRACTSTSAATTPRRAYQQGVAADHVSHEPRMNKTCSTHCTTVNIPFRTTCRDIWETTQTWPLPTNVHFAFTPTVVSGKFCPVFPNYRCLVRDDQSPTTRSQGSMFDSLSVIGLLWLV